MCSSENPSFSPRRTSISLTSRNLSVSGGGAHARRHPGARMPLSGLLTERNSYQAMSNEQYLSAREIYASWGVDTEAALKRLESIPISLHCWQGDDVGGFEQEGGTLSGGGIQATGNYPGKARTLGELRQDLDKALSLIPGKHRLNLHAIYADFGGGKDGSRATRSRPLISSPGSTGAKNGALASISTRASSRTR